MKNMRKGFFFSIDIMIAIIIAFIFILALSFHLSRGQEDPFVSLYLSKVANDILVSLNKNKTLETLNKTLISYALGAVLPKNLGAILTVMAYQCKDSSCSDFNNTLTFQIDRCRNKTADIMLVMDVSLSMEGKKLADAKVAAKTFVDQLDAAYDRSGLVKFSTTASLVQGLTFDQNVIKAAIDSLIAEGWTAIGEGIYTATNEITVNGRTGAAKIEVLLSDGQNNRGRNPLTAAQDAANKNIKIYTIGLGSDADQNLLRDIANITGGKYYFAPTSDDLRRIYLEIAKEIFPPEPEPGIARTAFLTFENSKIKYFSLAELRICLK